METTQLIKELELVSKKLFDKQDFYAAGRINLAIDTLRELLPKGNTEEQIKN